MGRLLPRAVLIAVALSGGLLAACSQPQPQTATTTVATQPPPPPAPPPAPQVRG